MSTFTDTCPSRVPWNKGRLTGQKPPLLRTCESRHFANWYWMGSACA